MKFSKSLTTKPDIWLFAIGLSLLAAHLAWQPQRPHLLQPIEIKQYALSMQFDGNGDDISVSTYVPQNTQRQTVIQQSEQSGGMDYRLEEIDGGLHAFWDGEELQGPQKITYRASIALRPVAFHIPPDAEIPRQYPSTLKPYLQKTDSIQVNHPEIARLWDSIKPDDEQNTLAVLQAIYNFTYQGLEAVPFKGMTDAVTALRLRQASCNGKSRLFVALARLNNIPARLVGGVILDNGKKLTSHQWAEVYVGKHWVPFGPTNGYFAAIPQNFLELYRGDEVLFSHTRDINFDYQFDIRTRRVAAGVQTAFEAPENADKLNVVALLAVLGLDEQTASIFLLFPFCALCITFFRNVVGVSSFGIFMPMLVAAACRYTGIILGLGAFFAVLGIAFAMHNWLEKARMLKVPRLAAVITVVTLAFLVGIASLNITESHIELGIISLFPVVIISFTAERLHHMLEDDNWRDALKNTVGTLMLIVLCYFAFSALLLRGLFALFPELFIVVLAAVIFIGRWTGVRASEFVRFFDLIKHSRGKLLSINARNRDLVMNKNPRELIRVANDKLLAKTQLTALSIPVPETIACYHNRLDSQRLVNDIESLHNFVIKPNHGSRGQGILVVRGRENNHWLDAGDHRLDLDDLQRHIQEILAGNFSANGAPDTAFIEPLLIQHEQLDTVAPFGLSDIRIVLYDGQPIASMWRVPTRTSHGKANIHQGAIGVAIDIASGVTQRAERDRKPITHHPDSTQPLIDITMPYWQDIIAIAKHCYSAVPLGYLGVDICIDQQRGPLVLEINARPGLEIQNIKDRGIHDLATDWPAGLATKA